jgi:hypothetical protein
MLTGVGPFVRHAPALPLLLALVLFGCGKPKPAVTEPPKEPEPAHAAPPPVMEQEFGSIDQDAVEQTFKKQGDALEACHTEGRSRVPYLAGDVKLFLRIDKTGHVKYGYFEVSSLGDRATETCILTALAKVDWPAPVGGEAEVRHAFGWEPGSERAPTPYEPQKVEKALDAQPGVRSRVEQCMKGVKGQVALTGYIEPGAPSKDKKDKSKPKPATKGKQGHFRSVGASASTKEAAEKVDCVTSAVSELSVPTPGSYAAKVSFLP